MKGHRIAYQRDFQEPDQWDCLYCRIARQCPYGQAVVELRDFCRLQASCPIREPLECGEILSSEIETCLQEIYGHDPLTTMNELAVYMRIHMC